MNQREIPYIAIPEEYALASGSFLARMYEEIGPIFRTHLLGREVIYLVGPDANRFVLVTHRHCFSHHQGWGNLRGTVRLLGNGLVTMDGAEHDWHRHMMHPAFTLAYMQRYVPALARQLQAHLSSWGDAGEIDIHAELRRVTFAILAEALAGLRSTAEVQHFQRLFTALLHQGQRGATDVRHLLALKAELYDLLQPKIQERRDHPTDDILGMLVGARDKQGQMLSDEQLIAHINFLVGLGHESTSSLCAWTIYLLASHPAYLRQVIDEQQRILVGGDALTLEPLTQMNALDRALKEAERLYPPIESGPRGVVADCEFAGYHIPAGAFVCYSIAATHLLPSVFAHPTTYDPDRFLPPREEHKKTPYALVGFGGGPRICIAGHLANVDIKAMITGILRRYHVEAVAGEEPRQVYRGIGMPENGMRLRLRLREA